MYLCVDWVVIKSNLPLVFYFCLYWSYCKLFISACYSKEENVCLYNLYPNIITCSTSELTFFFCWRQQEPFIFNSSPQTFHNPISYWWIKSSPSYLMFLVKYHISLKHTLESYYRSKTGFMLTLSWSKYLDSQIWALPPII